MLLTSSFTFSVLLVRREINARMMFKHFAELDFSTIRVVGFYLLSPSFDSLSFHREYIIGEKRKKCNINWQLEL